MLSNSIANQGKSKIGQLEVSSDNLLCLIIEANKLRRDFIKQITEVPNRSKCPTIPLLNFFYGFVIINSTPYFLLYHRKHLALG
jgi:hypothetical protein